MRAIQSLLSELNSDLNATEMTLSRVEDSLLQLTSDIDDTTRELEQVTLTNNHSSMHAEPQHSHSNYEYWPTVFVLTFNCFNTVVYIIIQTRDISVSVNSTFHEVQSIVENASSVVDSATLYAMELRNRSRQLRLQASEDEERSRINANVRDTHSSTH